MKRFCFLLFCIIQITVTKAQTLPRMIPIKGDTFIIGNINGAFDEKPSVVIVKNYSISETEITVAQWKEYCKNNNINIRASKKFIIRLDSFPISMITWHEAMKYCEWLSKKTGLHYSLPTEMQWEYRSTSGE